MECHQPVNTGIKNAAIAVTALVKPVMKIFTASSMAQVENEVNAWLQIKDINLLHVTQSQSEQGGRFVFTVSLFYIQQ